jgi:hypothetical protein
MSGLVKRGLPLRFSGDPTAAADDVPLPSARLKPVKVADDITAVLNVLLPAEYVFQSFVQVFKQSG